MLLENILYLCQCLIDIGSVGDWNGQIHLTDRTEVMQNLSDNLAIGNDDPRSICMHQRRREDIDDDNISMNAEQRDMFADLVGLAEDD